MWAQFLSLLCSHVDFHSCRTTLKLLNKHQQIKLCWCGLNLEEIKPKIRAKIISNIMTNYCQSVKMNTEVVLLLQRLFGLNSDVHDVVFGTRMKISSGVTH